MILSDEQVIERLTSLDNIVNIVDGRVSDSPVMDELKSKGSIQIVPTNKTGIGSRGPEIPDLIRRLINQTTNASDESKTEVANVFGVGVPEVSKYSRGLIHNRLDTELQELGTKTAEQKTETAHNLALDSLVESLGLVTKNIDQVTTLKEASRLAVDMSRIVEKLKPKEVEDTKPNTLVVIAMPNMRKESQFEVIDV